MQRYLRSIRKDYDSLLTLCQIIWSR